MRGLRHASGGVLLLALTLLASALLKLVDPFPAAQALAWTGASHATRLAAVVALSAAEAVLGAWLAAGFWSRLVLWTSTAFAGALAAGHAAVSILGDGSACGCFGGVPVPDAVTYGLLGAGGLSCALRVRSSVQPPRWPTASWRAGIAAALAIAATHPVWLGESRAAEASPADVLAALDLADPGAHEIVMIGSWACSHCSRAIDEIEREREGLRDDVVLHLVQRRSDRAKPMGVARGWIREHHVADALWWAMVADRPPVFLRCEGERIHLASGWR